MTETETEQLLQGIASALHVALNGDREKKMGFIVMVFPFEISKGAAPRLHCVSNTAQGDIPDVLATYLKNMQGIIRGPEDNSRKPS